MLNNLFYVSYIDDLDTRASLVNWDGGSTTSRIETYKMEKRFFLEEPYKPKRRE